MINQFKFFEGRIKRLYHYDLLVGGVPVEVITSNEPPTHFFSAPTQHLGFYVGVQNTQLELIYDGDMDELSVMAMVDELKYRYTNYVSINEQVIGFMEDFLNEHLDGTSTIRLT
jgi:hypothetical protein